MNWIEYWNGAPPLYVNARHKLLHGRQVARDIITALPGPDAAVMDYGCGEALAADEVAAACGRLILVDAADTVRAGLESRFSGNATVSVLAPDDVADIAEHSLDLIVVNSLLQYLDRQACTALLATAHDKLKPEGRLVVADVVPPDVSPIADAGALLAFAARGGFLLAALGGLARTALSGYGRLRKQLGFTTYAEDEFLTLLDHAGFDGERRQPNFGHNQARMCFIARPRPAPGEA
jgi:SAM-dependent methyltransferase